MEKTLIFLTKTLGPYILKNLDNLKIRFLTQIRYRNDYIRLSISYLYRIKIDNKYLLVKGNRIQAQFQPIGGVYKFKPSAQKTFNKLKVLTESGYTFDADLKDDLRIKVIGKNVVKFINWFKSEEDRETNPLREFREELLDTKILTPKSKFETIDYDFIDRIICPLTYSPQFECMEILIRDIYEFNPTPEQEKALRKIFNTESEDYRWFEPEEIRRRGRTNDRKEYKVGDHTLSIL